VHIVCRAEPTQLDRVYACALLCKPMKYVAPRERMRIVVCPLSQVSRMVAAYIPERVVSLLDPDFTFPDFGSSYGSRHLRLRLHDVHSSEPGQVGPTPDHVEQLLLFLSAWQRSAPLLIHCRAGIGRSTAAAFIAACLHSPQRDEREIALDLRRISPLARPNELLIKLADFAMNRNGRMVEAVIQTGRNLAWHGVDENVPFELTCET
jgi:predicted protein tyrosine phosphatase